MKKEIKIIPSNEYISLEEVSLEIKLGDTATETTVAEFMNDIQNMSKRINSGETGGLIEEWLEDVKLLASIQEDLNKIVLKKFERPTI